MDAVAWLLLALVCVGGRLSWGFVEYGIHGFLSHRWRTPISPLHWGHHREPRAVFTAPAAWVPATLVFYGLLAWFVGTLPALAFVVGLLLGFARYEHTHWRIHFREPRDGHEARLRAHHLAHHFVNPRAYHGVTTHRWDRVFGTFPETWGKDYARVADRPPLEGVSNLRDSWNPFIALARVRAASRSTRNAP